MPTRLSNGSTIPPVLFFYTVSEFSLDPMPQSLMDAPREITHGDLRQGSAANTYGSCRQSRCSITVESSFLIVD